MWGRKAELAKLPYIPYPLWVPNVFTAAGETANFSVGLVYFEQELQAQTFSVCIVAAGAASNFRIALYDLKGARLWAASTGTLGVGLNTGALPPRTIVPHGVYFLAANHFAADTALYYGVAAANSFWPPLVDQVGQPIQSAAAVMQQNIAQVGGGSTLGFPDAIDVEQGSGNLIGLYAPVVRFD